MAAIAVQLDCTQRIRLHPHAAVIASGPGVELTHLWGRHRLVGLGQDEVDLLQRMTREDVAVAKLSATRLARLPRRLPNLVTLTFAHRGRDLVTATPINRRAQALSLMPVGDERVCLSRFAYLRRGEGDTLVLEAPTSDYRLTLHDPAVAGFVAMITSSAAVSDAAQRSGLDTEAAHVVVAVLGSAGLLEDRDDRLRLWEFHDLLFHHRSRYGLHDYPGGGRFAHADIPHAAAIAPLEESARVLELPVPSWDDVADRDMPLTVAMESRRSHRQYERPITLGELSEVLYRAARVRDIASLGGEHPYVGVDRPYPAGGALGELEIYVVVHRCGSVEPGVYRYDSAGHRLVLRNDDPALRAAVAGQAILATAGALTDPQVQLCITSRLDRVQWKYSAIAYALTLKHVGVLMQNLYLIATAMNLSACANGSGDTDVIAQGIGVDWAQQPPVGELVLGGAPAQSSPRAAAFRDIVTQVRGG
jgi:SagB-type dehydrogenase family enzyme